MMSKIPHPSMGVVQLSATVGRSFAVSPEALYKAWTTDFDLWFAQPSTLSLVCELGRAWFFYNRDEWGRHPHYGRFLQLVPDKLIETTSLTGNGTEEGTCGAETILRIELKPEGNATVLKLTHVGFVAQRSRDAQTENWPLALDELADALKAAPAFDDA